MPENKRVRRREPRRLAEASRCTYVGPEGERCKQSRWAGKKVCFQHDPQAAELRMQARRRGTQRVTKADEVEELLNETLEDLRSGRIKIGQAYAVGYLAQLMLAAQQARLKEVKLDVKWFWDMVDLGVALENAEKKLKEKKAGAGEDAEGADVEEEETEEDGEEDDDGGEAEMDSGNEE